MSEHELVILGGRGKPLNKELFLTLDTELLFS